MSERKTKYYVLKEKAVPEVLLKVIEAKKLMETGNLTVQEATERAGISRSSFYKYKDDIFPFHDNAKGKTITFLLQMDDAPGLNGVASLTISVDIARDEGDASAMVEEIEGISGVHYFKILGQQAQ